MRLEPVEEAREPRSARAPTPGDVRALTQITELFDAHVVALYAWIGRITGGVDVSGLLGETFIAFCCSPVDLGRPSTDVHRLMAIAIDLAHDHPEIDGVSSDDRALIEMMVVRSLDSQECARLVGRTAIDVSASVAASLDRAGLPPSSAEADRWLRRGESWLDDQTRAACLDAVVAGVASKRAVQPDSALSTAGLASRRDRHIPLRRVLIASATLGALLVAGFAASWRGAGPPSGRTGDASSVGTTRSTSGVVPTPVPSSVDSEASPREYVLASRPEGFDRFGTISVDEPPEPTGWLQLWASPGSSRTRGTWVSAVLSRCSSTYDGLRTGATRTTINGRPAISQTDDDDVTTVSVGLESTTGSQTLEVSGHGYDTAALESIASAIVLEPDDTSCSATAPIRPIEVQPGFDELVDGSPTIVVEAVAGASLLDVAGTFGRAQHGVIYVADAGSPVVLLSAVIDDQPRGADIVSRFAADETIRTGTLTSGGRVIAVTERSRRVGSFADNSVAWSQDGRRFTLSGPLPPTALLGLVPGVHLASATEWNELTTADESAPPPASAPPSVVRAPKVHNIGSATIPDGRRFQLLVTPGRGTLSVNAVDGSSADVAYTLDPADAVIEFDSSDVTVLVIVVPGALDGQTVQVEVGGKALPGAALSRPEPQAPAFAIVAFSDFGAFSVHLVDDNGDVGDELGRGGDPSD